MSMKVPVILVVFCWLSFTSCGKKDAAQNKAEPTPEQAAQIESEYILPANKTASPTAPTAANPAPPAPGQPLPNRARPVQPIQERINGAIHAQLTVQLRMYVEKNGRMPQSFAEFAFRSIDSVQAAPEGMKFVIDPVDKAVKVVKK
jgi:hypothetical protein